MRIEEYMQHRRNFRALQEIGVEEPDCEYK